MCMHVALLPPKKKPGQCLLLEVISGDLHCHHYTSFGKHWVGKAANLTVSSPPPVCVCMLANVEMA